MPHIKICYRQYLVFYVQIFVFISSQASTIAIIITQDHRLYEYLHT